MPTTPPQENPMVLPRQRRVHENSNARRYFCVWTLAGAVCAQSAAARAAAHSAGIATDRWFTSSDGVRLHYLESGRAEHGRPTLVFVPGWTMPAWIWQAQLAHFAAIYRVLAFDPRGQGRSAIPATGYDYARRATDIAELLRAADCNNVVLVGWSLGVLESLRYMHDMRGAPTPSPVRGLVLVDNSVGEGEPPPGNPNFMRRLRSHRDETVRGFVQSMFKRPVPEAWLDELVLAATRMPLQSSIALLSQPTPREFWRETLYAINTPVLYAYTTRFAGQGELVKKRKPSIETALFAEAGHALFVDAAEDFNEMLGRFVAQLGDAGHQK